MKEELKFDVNPKDYTEKVIGYRVAEYERIRFENTLKEIKLINEIIESAKNNPEIVKKYTEKLEALRNELDELRGNFANREAEER